MPHDDERARLEYRGSPGGGGGLLGTVLTVVGGAILLVVGFMFSLLALAVVAVVGSLGLGYMWWKTRALRRHLREQMAQMQTQQQDGGERNGSPGDGVIIEGEVIREDPPERH